MKRFLAVTGIAFLLSGFAAAQEGQRVVVPARNSTRPRQVKVVTIQSGVTVRTHAAKEVIVEAAGGSQRHARERAREQAPPGMHRIDMPPGGFTVSEDDNVVTVNAGPTGGNLIVTVPVDTSVQVKSTQGKVTVDGVHGEVDASCTNGALDLTNISGTIVAETTNGAIHASMDRLDPAKPISFSTINGSIEVALPADVKANLKMRSFNGSIWSDFELKLTGGAQAVPNPGGADGKFQVKVDRTVYGTINGGGVEASFSTLNGRIVLRKK